MDELFPLFLKLTGRACLIVGGGSLAEGKMQGLLKCGASVHLVAPDVTPGIREAARLGRMVWRERTFVPSDLMGIFLVIAASNSAELHEEIFRRSRELGILCNAVDEPERCDFYYPAVVRRGPLQIAISTAGHSPLLAQRLRRELEDQFGPEYGPWIEEIGRQRRELFQSRVSQENRRAILKELSSERAFREFRARRSVDAPADRTIGKVFFVGAGPGSPDLLTGKARNVLEAADVVLHDALVSPDILRLVPKSAMLSDVGKRCGKKSITQEAIHGLLIHHASMGRRVVRLQGGDPLIFGRAAEEIAALRGAGVEFEVIPGVTAASAVAAAAKIALTDRRIASQVVFMSGHSPDEQLQQDLRQMSVTGATLVIYMPGRDYRRISLIMLAAGLSGETPCLIVSQASTANELIYKTDVASLVAGPAVETPALLVVGWVAAHAETEDVLTMLGASSRA